MKKILAICLCLGALLGLMSGCRQEEPDRFVKIGIFEPTTGENALYGNQELLGAQFARTVRQDAVINGEKYTVQLIEKNTESRIYGSVYAARELAEEGVAVVIGTYGSSACNVAASAFAAANISAIGVSCTDPNVTAGNPNYYRVCYLDAYQGKLLAQYAYERGARVAYCLAQTDRDYDREMCNYFIAEFKALGGTVVTSVVEVEYNTYSTSLNNFADYINGAVNNKADVLFSPIPVGKGAQLIKECTAADVRFDILGDDTWDHADIGAAAKDSFLTVSCATLFSGERSEECQSFVNAFQDWLRADPKRLEANGGTDEVSPASALGYDAYMTAVAAIEAANSTEPAAVSAALGGVQIDGVTGHIAFDANGDVDKSELYIKKAEAVSGTLHFEKAQQLRLTPNAAVAEDKAQ